MDEQKPDPEPVHDLSAQPAQLRMTIEIIRAVTGKKEVFELVSTPEKEGR